MTELLDWAREQFADASFGDVRRTERAAKMLRRAAERPAGRLTEVFRDEAELQAAYNFVEGGVRPSALTEAFARSTLRTAAQDDSPLYVVVDGTSLTLVDHTKRKSFGSVGARKWPTRGLKVVDAIGVSSEGVPVGLLDLKFWARGAKTTASRWMRRRAKQTEVCHWLEVIDRVRARACEAHVRPWFVIDREGDCSDILRAVSQAGASFTVRASQYNRLCVGPKDRNLRQAMKRRPVAGTHFVDVPARDGRRARTAVLDVSFGQVVLQLGMDHTRRREPFVVNVVWARERGGRHGQERLDWMLLTNAPLASYEDAIAVLDGYCLRWRVEDFHRTWKRGGCRVEETQLHHRDHVLRWATMLAAVALRIERLKHLARTQPDEPATIELTELEIEALRAHKTAHKKRNEVLPKGVPSIRLAVLWLAQYGGYVGKADASPGAITIGRGLQRLQPFVDGIKAGLKLARRSHQS